MSEIGTALRARIAAETDLAAAIEKAEAAGVDVAALVGPFDGAPRTAAPRAQPAPAQAAPAATAGKAACLCCRAEFKLRRDNTSGLCPKCGKKFNQARWLAKRRGVVLTASEWCAPRRA